MPVPLVSPHSYDFQPLAVQTLEMKLVPFHGASATGSQAHSRFGREPPPNHVHTLNKQGKAVMRLVD